MKINLNIVSCVVLQIIRKSVEISYYTPEYPYICEEHTHIVTQTYEVDLNYIERLEKPDLNTNHNPNYETLNQTQSLGMIICRVYTHIYTACHTNAVT